MREIGVISADIEKSFADIDMLVKKCKFNDCTHISEPGCAVRDAIENEALDSSRFENYLKIQTEAGYSGLSSRQIEEAKINKMFGGKNSMKKLFNEIKRKNKYDNYN